MPARAQPFSVVQCLTGKTVGRRPRLVDRADEFHAFVAGRWHALVRTGYLLTGDHHAAEDLVQSALVRTHRRWDHIERKEAVEAYVIRTMINLQCNHWRRRRVGERLYGEVPEQPVGGRDHASAFHLRDELWSALQALPTRMRAVLVLRYFEDLSEVETADLLGCAVGTVKSQASRGLERLRQIYAREGAAPAAVPIAPEPA